MNRSSMAFRDALAVLVAAHLVPVDHPAAPHGGLVTRAFRTVAATAPAFTGWEPEQIDEALNTVDEFEVAECHDGSFEVAMVYEGNHYAFCIPDDTVAEVLPRALAVLDG